MQDGRWTFRHSNTKLRDDLSLQGEVPVFKSKVDALFISVYHWFTRLCEGYSMRFMIIQIHYEYGILMDFDTATHSNTHFSGGSHLARRAQVSLNWCHLLLTKGLLGSSSADGVG